MQKVLIAEDEPDVRSYLGLALSCHGYEVEFARDGEEAIGLLRSKRNDISLMLLDLIMPKKDGLETLRDVKRSWPGLPVITLSGSCTPSHVAAVMKGGAVDFLAKPIAHDQLLKAVRMALKISGDKGGGSPLQKDPVSQTAEYSQGAWSQRVRGILAQMATSEAPVLLRGETGVGKEVFARELHAHSKRAERPFLKLNCAALPSELVESELFGYEKGAFTGAYKTTPGKFEIADKGTILLDEIGDMDFRLQAKLLQVLQDREFLRLGAKQSSRVDVRVMAATHCDLEKAIKEKRFREDLYYRLNIVEIHVPPLRQRKDEIPALAQYFLSKHGQSDAPELTGDLCDVLLDHDWPGNVRELENVVRKYLIFRSVESIADGLKRPLSFGLRHAASAEHKSEPQPETVDKSKAVGKLAAAPKSSPTLSATLAQVAQAGKQAETDAILRTLNATMWNRKRAAKLLNVDYKALLYRMKKLGLGDKHAPLVSEADDQQLVN